MGLLHAARLVEAGFEVTLLDHNPRRAGRISRNGVRVERMDAEVQLAITGTARPEGIEPPDLILICVKSYGTPEAAQMAAWIPGDAPVLTLQNGLGNWEALAETLPISRVLVGVTPSGATLLGEGHVREAGIGTIRLGAPSGPRSSAEHAAAILNAGGLPAEVKDDIEAALWFKAMVNAAINPITAVTDLTNGELLADADLMKHAVAIAEEVAGIAEVCGIGLAAQLGGKSPGEVVADVCRLTAQNRSSMLQDVTAGRRTEIESINGEIARRAAECGLRAPLCEEMVRQIHALVPADQPSKRR
jgi:2-dehydropantoate 2-reductase